MNKVKIALLALFASFSTQVVKAEEVTEDFESVTIVDADGNAVSAYSYGKGLSNGWKIVGGQIYNGAGSADYGLWSTAYNGSKKSLEASYSSTNSAIVVIPAQLTGTFKFYARKTSSSSSTKGYVDLYDVEEDGTTYKKSSSSSFKYWTLTSTTWTEYTVDLGDEPRMIAICLSRAAIDDVVFNTYEAAAGPRLQVLQDGKAVKSGAAYNFGLVGEDATVEYTIKNAGTETMNATLACTGAYSVSDASVNLAEGEEKVVTVTLSASSLGSQEGTLTVSPEGLDAFAINLSGIVRDPAKLYVDFSEAPANWTIDAQNWTIADGYAKIGYFSSYSDGTGRMETPLISVAEGETIYLRYSKNTTSSYSSAYFTIQTSADGVTWTKLGDNRGTDAVYGEWKETTITGIPTSAKYIAISGQYIAIDDFYGLELSADPVMVVADETVTDNAIALNFGKCKADATKTYTIKNIGAGALHVDLANSNTTDFTISETSLEVAAGESATFDLTFNFSTAYGTKNATVTLTPNAGEVITINVTAAAQDPEEYTEDFEGGIPATWTNNGWTVENAPSYGNGTKMMYSGYSNSNTLVSPRLQAKAGDVIDIQALQKWNDEPLTLEYSIDDAETWVEGFSEVPAANNTLHTLQFTAPQDGIYLLRFSGRYNYIDNICGFKLAQIPVMEVSTTGASREGDVFTDNFGRQAENASHTYTVANTGGGTLTVNIASDNADFTVSEATLEVGAGESKTFDLTFVHSDKYGAKAAVVTITPANAGLSPVTINASAVCADPEVFFVDFEDGVPATMANTGWTIQTKNESKMAYSYTSDDYKLTTPLLVANEGEEMTFDAFQQWDDEPLKLEYSLDYGYTWETAFEEAPAANNTARQFTFTAPQAGKYLVRFSGSYNYIDNIYGFKLAEVSELALKAESEGTYYATFSCTEDVTFATDVTVSTVSVVDEAIVLTEVENGFVPANTGVLISSKNTSASYTVMTATSQISTDNMLVAASVAMEGDNLFYKLAYNDYSAKTYLGFYWGAADGAAFSAKAGGAYLAVPNAAPVKGYVLNGTATAIESVKAQDVKAIFNLQGQRIQQMQKGINIVNGRKVIK